MAAPGYHLLLAGDIAHVGGAVARGAAVVDSTGALVASSDASITDLLGTVTGIVGAASTFMVFGNFVAPYAGIARFLTTGAHDPTFANPVLVGTGTVQVHEVIPDGTGYFVRGSFTTVGGVARSGFARLSADGSLDTAWPSPNTAPPTAMAVQDGKMVLVADGTLYRVDASGVDGTFDPTTFPLAPNSLFVQSDDKLVLTGPFTAVGSVSSTGIVRISDAEAEAVPGIPDLQIASGAITGVAAHGTGLLVFGTFTSAFGGTANRILRLNADGSHDTGFAPGVINGNVNAAIELASGKILIGGTFTTVGGTARQRVAALNTDGTLDTGFTPPTVNGAVGLLYQQADDKILIIGAISSAFTSVGGISMPAIARLNADGTHDASYFGPVPAASNGTTISAYRGVLPQSDGKVVLWGAHDTIRGAPMANVVRVDEDGTTAGFVNLAPNSSVVGAVELASGKIILAGNFTTIGGVAATYTRIARLNDDGTLDNTYPALTITAPDTGGQAIVSLLSGKHLVYTGSSPYLYRLNADGTIDGGYTPPTINGSILHAARQSDGKVLLVGSFTSIDGDTRTRLARLTADGTYDNTFPNLSLTAANTGARIWVLDNDDFVINPATTSFSIDGNARTRIAKVSAAGVVDTTWSPAPNDAVTKVAQQSGGAIIVSGNFTSIGGLTRNRIARLNSDGTADTTFPNTSYGGQINDFVVLPDDRLFHGGTGTGGSNYFVLYDEDGAIDGSFINFNAGQTVNLVHRLPSGDYLAAFSDGAVRRIPATGLEFDAAWVNSASGGAVQQLLPVDSGAAFLLLGSFSFEGAKPHGRLTRLNTDSSLDTSYPGYSLSPFSLSRVFIGDDDDLMLVWSNAQRFKRSPTGVDTEFTGTAGNNVTMTADGKVYQSQTGSPFHLMRLNADGTDDTGYGTVAFTGTSVSFHLDPQDAGVILVGAPVSVGGVDVQRVARLNADGSIDPAWVGSTGYSTTNPARVFDAGSGKLYVKADLTVGLDLLTTVHRLTTTGAFDTWSNGDTVGVNFYRNIAVDPADFGVFGFSTDTSTNKRLLKFDAAGDPVTGWTNDTDGTLFVFASGAQPGPMRALGSGKLLVTGDFSEVNGIARPRAVVLEADGDVDAGFASPGIVADSIVGIDVVGSNYFFAGEIYAAGTRPAPHAALRVADWSYSTAFLTEPYINPTATFSGVGGQLNTVRLLADGRAYIAGRFATLGGGITHGEGGYACSSLARILPDGAPDRTFGNAKIENWDDPEPPQDTFPGMIHALDVQADGSIVVVGEFDHAGGIYLRENLVRISSAGVVDATFFRTLNAPAYAVAVRTDGKIWVGGAFSEVDATAQSGIVLLNADGTVDTSFADPLIDVGTSDRVYELLPLSDGKVIGVGDFDAIDGVASDSCVRFNADGSVDGTFNAAVSGVLRCGARDSSGRIYVGGTGGVFRLLSTGAADGTWSNPFVAPDLITSIEPLADGTVVVAGEFVRSGHHGVALLTSAGAFAVGFPAVPLLQSNGQTALVTGLSAVATPPLTMFPLYPSGLQFESVPTSIAYRTYGGVLPHTHEVVGRLPGGMAQDGDTVEGTPSEPGVHYWKIIAHDAAGEAAEEVTRFQVAPLLTPHSFLAFRDDVNRIDPDGSDETLVIATNGVIEQAYRLRDRKIVIIGTFTTVDGATRNKVARLLPDGTLDATFTGPASSTDVVGTPQDVAEQSTGKLIVTSTDTVPATDVGYAVRLNTDGTLDATFTLDARAQVRRMQRVLVLAGDNLLFGAVPNSGSTGRYDAAMVFRTSPDGALDEAFLEFPEWELLDMPEDAFTSSSGQMFDLRGGTIPTGALSTTGVYDIAIDENGDYIVAGSFIRTNGPFGVDAESVVRVFQEGAHDRSWGTKLNGALEAVNYPARPIASNVWANADGTFQVVGAFTDVGFESVAGSYAHLDPGGGTASNPEDWTGAPVYVQSATRLADGRIMTTGWRAEASNVRIFPDGTLDASFTQPATVAKAFLPDDLGIDGFAADGTFSIDPEVTSEEPDVFTADSAIYLFGPVPEAVLVNDSIVLNGSIGTLPIAVMRARLALAGVDIGTYEGTAQLSDAVVLGDPLAYVLSVLLEEGLVVGDTLTTDYTVLARVVARLLMSGAATGYAEAIVQVLDALVMAGLAQAMAKGDIAETVVLTDTIAGLYLAFAQILERLIASGTATGTSTAYVLVDETVVLASDLAHELELTVMLRESIGFAATLSFDNGEYIAWVMNTEGAKPVSRYTQFPFNSFAKVGGRYMACDSTGLHWLDGADDNGEAITARLRAGMQAMGTRREKRLPEAFLYARTDGELRLQVIQVDADTGEKVAGWFKVQARPASNSRETRVKTGRGWKAVEFDIVLENIDGADFDVTSIEPRPLNLDRRTRG